MQINKYFTLLLLLFIQLSGFADIAIPKSKPEPNTKYYFANVDSFANYSFYVKKVNNGKVYKLKQDAAFQLNANSGSENNKLEVWSERRSDKQKSNSFVLSSAKSTDVLEGNTAYIAILFYFDKSGKLNYKQTVLKPDCYSKKKNSMPFFAVHAPGNNNVLLFMAITSLLLLLSVFIYNKMPDRNAYI